MVNDLYRTIKMRNVVWIASYPKSGNTWFRVFLNNLLGDRTHPLDINQLGKTIPFASNRHMFDEILGIDTSLLSFEEIQRLRPEVYRFISRKSKETVILKIHDAYTFTDKDTPLVPADITYGAIYIIRNPLDITVSFANHSGITIDQSILQMNDEFFCLSDAPGRMHFQLRQRLLSWSGHVSSWTNAEDLNLHVIKYENMRNNPLETFTQAVKFMGLSKNRAQIERALKFSDIKELRRQEQEKGFTEKSPWCESFFNKGETGYWKELLTKKQAQTIINAHKDVMKQYNYL